MLAEPFYVRFSRCLKLDIESSIFINKNRDHAWLGVWIEATNGHFIGPDSGYEITEVRDNEMNVILKASIKRVFGGKNN